MPERKSTKDSPNSLRDLVKERKYLNEAQASFRYGRSRSSLR